MPGRSAVRSSSWPGNRANRSSSGLESCGDCCARPRPPRCRPSPMWCFRQKERAAGIDRLQDWSMNDDAESLNHIVAGLTSPEKEIREAAIEATKQSGSTNAISALKADADSGGEH